MNAKQSDRERSQQALGRLLQIAAGSTGQSRKVADFLLAWHNAEENGGWDPVDLWSVDAGIADDILTVLHLIHAFHCYLPELGFGPEIAAVWQHWRSNTSPTSKEAR
jgi:hypothetical protein